MLNDHLSWKGLRRSDPDRPRPLADAVLRLIWQEERLSRADIAQAANLSRSTVSEIVGEILPLGIVTEVGEGPSRGGRRPIVLEFRDDACVILGVEMSGSHVVAVLTDLRGRALTWESRPHPVRDDPEGTRRLIAELCRICLATPAGQERPLLGIGVALPSPVDPANPDRLSNLVLPAWKQHLGLDGLAAGYGVPLMVDNDANLGALAEHWWGAGRGGDDIVYIKVATGVGSGHIIGGEVYRGATGVAGEIGHISIDPQGKPCICGLRGCLVTLVGAPALVARAGELAADYPDSPLAGRPGTIQEIEDAALAGDPLALQVAREAAAHLGRAVASTLNILNPSLVIVGGDLARLGDLLLDPLREMVQQRTLVSSVAAAEIRASELGPRAVAIGAATLVLKAALADSRLFPSLDTEMPAPPRAAGS
ncbi:MAG: ROK family transcriptional regulator [Krumholzibacteria bacterium]|nr:ROK family transcriptional regulator [Candidatus Krumholzibacteria bacterium]